MKSNLNNNKKRGFHQNYDNFSEIYKDQRVPI